MVSIALFYLFDQLFLHTVGAAGGILTWIIHLLMLYQVCRISLSEGWEGCCYSSRRRSSFVAGIQPQDSNTYLSNTYFFTVIYLHHIYVYRLQIANNTGYIQVDWKRVEKDVNKAKKQLKKNTDKAVPELNTFVEKVFGALPRHINHFATKL